ncbi:trypsin-like peptidase domain-containing protein [bacterium BMS3Abin03]|nr:trypsin-like peptidase domain-containing protein [bacterium BMS3Abin03]MCG6960778.1 trypsin-like peptidase domain-containing protein [bacterium BMS3Abin03]
MNTTKNLIIAILAILVLVGGIYIVDLKQDQTGDINSNDSSLTENTFQQEKQNQNDEISNSRKNIITETVKKISPGVVGINVIEIQKYRDPFSSFFDDPFFRQFFGDRGSRSREIKELGSGYLISSDGYIVTNDHVAGNASQITVTLTNGKNYDGKLIGTDPVSDIALLKIDGHDFSHVNFGNSDDIMIGEWVIAFGNPFGLFEINDKPTVTVGVVSALGMNLEPLNDRYYLNMIQTDAAINGGNSGGPLVNSLGEVIGMNTLIYTAGSQGSIGLGFAIPINKVKRIVNELKKNGKIDRDFEIGMRIQGIDESIAKYYHLDRTRGVIITNVYPGTPADKAGLQAGDIILKIDKYIINNEDTVFGVFFEFRTGQVVNLEIVRDGDILNKKMKLEPKR